jgi:cysteine desulfurase
MNDVIYLDHNATTPVDEAVLEAMLPLFRGQFGNPASSHVLGRAAHDAVERARCEVADLIGGASGRIVFTSSATEANNLAIAGLLGRLDAPCHVVTTLIEHKSVLEPIRHLEQSGRARVTWLRPDPFGQVRPEQLQAALTAETRLVSIMAASNVIHTLNPIAELARVCAAAGILFHCDATQWVGRLPLDSQRLGIDAVSVSAHKLYGPKGAGALWLSRRAMQSGLTPLILGGGQEEGLRSGTLNVPAIVGFGAACKLAASRMVDDAARARTLGQRLLDGLRSRVGGITLNGHPEMRLPGGLHLTLDGVDSKGLIASLREIALSDGSACETDRDPDYVLKAVGRPEAAHHSIRCQVGRTTTPAQIERAIELLADGIERMRAFVL